jgi:predicted SAM-dependent methyltransferase
MAVTEKYHWLEFLIPGFFRRFRDIQSLRGERDKLAALNSGLKDQNETLQRQIAKREKNNVGLRQQVERRDQIAMEIQGRLKKQEAVIEKLQKRLEVLQSEKNEIYNQYNLILNRSFGSTKLNEFVAFGKRNLAEEGQSEAVQSQGWRLNMGCGRVKKSGYLNVDVDASVKPDLVLSLDVPLPFASNIFELIEAYHVIEHVYPWATLDVLREVWRILKPGGRLAIECPSIEAACSWLARNSQYDWRSQMGMWAIYGDPNPKNQLQMHKWGYTPVTLAEILNEVGFVKIERRGPETHVPARDFRLTATKPLS